MAYRDPEHRWPGGGSNAISRVIVVAAILLVVIFVIWAISTGAIHIFGGGDPKTPTPNRTSAAPLTQPSSGTTKAVNDGDLQMRLQTVRSDGARKLVVTLNVQNTSSSFVSFYAENQLLSSTDNRSVRGAVALTTLEPHETAGVAVVFNLPANFHASRLELHAAPGSPGVRVTLK